ncbi:hypothetical protein [Enterobacter asburiae]|uniref:hypothetical protein n=1 Tax=Enterobacter asburiae TaxID=61645 RepID=UPI001F26568F|nr:hypothetical protein [Enterobacter asburiae]
MYEVDARLRPSGAAGMLVTSTDSFADYQKNEWTWEHQALVARSRGVRRSAAQNASLTSSAGRL